MLLGLIHDADLTDEQERQLTDIRRHLDEQSRDLRSRSKANAREVRAEMAQANPDAARLHRLIGDDLGAHAEIVRETTDAVLALVATFNPAQKEHLLALASAEPREDVRKADMRSVFGTAAPGTPPAAARLSSRDANAHPDSVALAIFDRKRLTEAQRGELDGLRADVRSERSLHDVFLRLSVPEIASELATPEPDVDKVHAVVERALAQEASSAHAAVEAALHLRTTLTKAQATTLAARQTTHDGELP
jgi:hypothetical protein